MATITETNGDASDDFDTQYALSLGDIFQGAHDDFRDNDWIRVELSSEIIYNFTLRAEEQSNRFKLVDSEGGLHLHSNYSSTGSTLIFQPPVSGTYYIDIFVTFGNEYPIEYEIELTENTIPIGTYDDLADYLTDGYAEWSGGSRAAFNVGPGGILTTDITALNEAGQQLARWAIEAWSNVTGIEFQFVDDENADIIFDNQEADMASGGFSSSNGVIESGIVNVPEFYHTMYGTTIDTYTFLVYVHELGHALGLGHPGPYPKTIENRPEDTTFGIDNLFLIDSTQATLMSYIGPGENTYIQASSNVVAVTPMIVDIIAIHNLYGTPTDINTGDTVYGYHSNVGGYLEEFYKLWTGQDNPFAGIGTNQDSRLEFADLDGDGDLDLVNSGFYNIHYFENTGTDDSPDFTQRTGTANLLAGINDQLRFVIDQALADFDNDGDFDLIAVDLWGAIAYYENIGTATNPTFTRRTGAANPLDFVDEGINSNPAPVLADLDDDGDVDLILGSRNGITYFENTGTVTAPVFTETTGEASPLDGIFDEGSRRFSPKPDLADLDGDGDLDLIIGEILDGQIVLSYFENTGTASNPEFTLRDGAANPMTHIPGRLHARIAPELVDIDDDGDLDLAFGNYDGNIYYAENDGTDTNPEFIATHLTNRTALTLYDNGGTDMLDLRTDTSNQQVDLRPEGISDVYGLVGNLIIARDTLIENFIAGSGNDVVTGNTAANILEGRMGNDTLDGLAGNDTLYGNSGADTLNGGADNDKLYGGAGADMLNGGPGEDYAYYLNSNRGVLVRLHDARAVKFGEAEGDTLTGIEHLVGSDFNDILAGDGEDNVLRGGGGHDDLYGGPAGGDDMMYGDDGDDRIFGGRGNDTLTGGEGNDVMKGGPGKDTLIADGDDLDVLYGGPDSDTFRFFPSDLGGGSIRDFSDGEDVIDLTEFTGISSMDDLEITSHGDNVQIEVSGTDYLTIIFLSDFDISNLDNSDFLF